LIRKDIIIIGAGVAGLSCANYLSSQYDILIVSSNDITYKKPCAGLLSVQAYEYYKNTGAQNFYLSKLNFINLLINFGSNCLGNYELYNIERGIFELSIYKTLGSNCSLIITNNYEIDKYNGKYIVNDIFHNVTYETEVLIAADGVNSNTRKLFGYSKIPTLLLTQYHINKEYPSAIFFFTKAVSPLFYFWIVPKGNTTIIGGPNKYMDQIEQYIKNNVIDFDDSNITHKEHHLITKLTSINEIELGSNNLFFLGESAGLVMPSSGEGLTSAFESSYYLSTILLSSKKNLNDSYKYIMEPRIKLIADDLTNFEHFQISNFA
jgi:flavin-dependent dehydrogenase